MTDLPFILSTVSLSASQILEIFRQHLFQSRAADVAVFKGKKKKEKPQYFLDVAEIPNATFQSSVSTIIAQNSRNPLPAPNQTKGCFSALLFSFVSHLAD